LREVAVPRTALNEGESISTFALSRALPVRAAHCCSEKARKGQHRQRAPHHLLLTLAPENGTWAAKRRRCWPLGFGISPHDVPW